MKESTDKFMGQIIFLSTFELLVNDTFGSVSIWQKFHVT